MYYIYNMFKCNLCNFNSNYKGNLKQHKINKHDIGTIWFYCDIQIGLPGCREKCDYKCKEKSSLKKHKKNKHDIGTIWFYCEKCDYKCKTNSDLKRHKVFKHDINIKWIYCDQQNCDFKCKNSNTILKQHKANIHNINTVWFYCNQENCEYKTKTNGRLKEHKSYIHDINTVWLYCDQLDCEYKCKINSHLKQHKCYIHDIDVIWFTCDQENCKFKCKSNGEIKSHKINIHNINTKWNFCTFPECVYKCKQNINLKRHFNCIHTKEGQARQKIEEQKVARLFKKNNISFERETYINFKCFDADKDYAKIDFVLYKKDCTILLEVDENQHKYGEWYSISCDMKRMSHIYTAIRCGGNVLPILFLRYNPHTFRIGNIVQKVKQIERQKELTDFINTYIPSREGLKITYMYYDKENNEDHIPLIAKSDEYNKEMKLCIKCF